MSKSIDIITTNHCQLQCKFCLNSKLKGNFPVDVMTYDQFVDVVDRCIDYGFDKFDLTPNVGDIFLDKDIMNKLIYLENNQYVKRYEFVTNFLAVTPLDTTTIPGTCPPASVKFADVNGKSREKYPVGEETLLTET